MILGRFRRTIASQSIQLTKAKFAYYLAKFSRQRLFV